MRDITLAFLAVSAAVFALCGCATKTRNVTLDGMYVSEAGSLAIGSVEVISAPVGEETASVKYEEDTAWLSPSTKTHSIRIMLTGTNSVSHAERIVSDICNAFVQSNSPTNSTAR